MKPFLKTSLISIVAGILAIGQVAAQENTALRAANNHSPNIFADPSQGAMGRSAWIFSQSILENSTGPLES
jgi:hypothetical protein